MKIQQILARITDFGREGMPKKVINTLKMKGLEGCLDSTCPDVRGAGQMIKKVEVREPMKRKKQNLEITELAL